MMDTDMTGDSFQLEISPGPCTWIPQPIQWTEDALRDQFAKAALPALIYVGVNDLIEEDEDDGRPGVVQPSSIAKTAYRIANAMMAARKRET